LRKYSLCRTPQEELLHRFQSAEVVTVLSNKFALHVHGMLRSLLLASPATRDMELSFVNGEHLNIDAGFFSDTWKIHNKWLTWEGAHEHTFCEEDQSAGQELFSCDHAVLQLWDIMISQLMATGTHSQIVTEERWLKSMARTRLSQMPRSVECIPTQKRGELLVTWESTDSHRHMHKTVKVVLHEGTCILSPSPSESFVNQNSKYLGKLGHYRQANSRQNSLAAALVRYRKPSAMALPSRVLYPDSCTPLRYHETLKALSLPLYRCLRCLWMKMLSISEFLKRMLSLRYVSHIVSLP
jgi:hypothetical protein